jgi:hypothetical protein
MSKIITRSEEPERPLPGPGDYFIVSTTDGFFYVSTAMARAIETALDRRWPRARWVTFVDLSGSRLRIRASTILGLFQSTAAQRAAMRSFERNQKVEIRTDKDWDEA